MAPEPPLKLAQTPTLTITRPFGRTLALGGLLVLVVALLAEGVARMPYVQRYLPGYRTSSLEFKLAALQDPDQPAACFVVGNSFVLRDIDPAILDRHIQARTGQSPACFNMGVEGLKGAQAGQLSAYLVQVYRPGLLIYGLAPNAFSPVAEGSFSPRQQYLLGQFTLEGWLSQRSVAYDYLLNIRIRGFDIQNPAGDESLEVAGHAGFDPFRYRGSDSLAATTLYPIVIDMLSDYTFTPEDLSGLQQILDLKRAGVTVVLVELPLPPAYVDVFDSGGQAYEQGFLAVIEQYARAGGVPFITLDSADLIPLDGWHYAAHLNEKGAAIYSAWLGEKLAALLADSGAPGSR